MNTIIYFEICSKIYLKNYIYFFLEKKKLYIIKASLFSLPKASHGVESALDEDEMYDNLEHGQVHACRCRL